jgi:chromosome segregation ATPase
VTVQAELAALHSQHSTSVTALQQLEREKVAAAAELQGVQGELDAVRKKLAEVEGGVAADLEWQLRLAKEQYSAVAVAEQEAAVAEAVAALAEQHQQQLGALQLQVLELKEQLRLVDGEGQAAVADAKAAAAAAEEALAKLQKEVAERNRRFVALQRQYKGTEEQLRTELAQVGCCDISSYLSTLCFRDEEYNCSLHTVLVICCTPLIHAISFLHKLYSHIAIGGPITLPC